MARDSGNSSGAVRALVFLFLAVAMGSGSLVVLYQLITQYQVKIDEAKRPEDMVMVIVAARDLYQGVTITEDDLYAVQIPPRFLPEGVFLSPEHVVGRIPRERILANEFVRADRLADPESGVGLNAVIPRGMRAISVNVTDGAALSGFLNPGNYVDVLVTYTPTEGKQNKKKPETKTILQAVFVLGVNSRSQNESTDEARELRPRQRPSVTLLVTAEQAERVAHAENMGQIVLSLRNDLDVIVSSLGGVDLDDLRSKIEAPVIRRVRPKPVKKCREMKIISGGEAKTMLVDDAGVPCNQGAGRRR